MSLNVESDQGLHCLPFIQQFLFTLLYTVSDCPMAMFIITVNVLKFQTLYSIPSFLA